MTIQKRVEVTVRNHLGGRDFAFFTHPELRKDIYVNLECLRKFGFGCHDLRAGMKAVIDVESYGDGKHRAVKIHSLGGKIGEQKKAGRRVDRPSSNLRLHKGDKGIGRIKVYYPNKGFGFLVFGDSDLFFHVEQMDVTLSVDDLVEGASFHFTVAANKRGPVAILNQRAERVSKAA